MLLFNKKEECCGCEACRQICPRNAINMVSDEQGFLYPNIDQDCCIDCGLCREVCPIINQPETHQPLNVYASKCADRRLRMKSSSGGIFTPLAEQIIKRGGVVFGVQFDEQWEAEHTYVESEKELWRFRLSKYMQSRIGDSYRDAERLLIGGREVLFSGTPCQIAGLKGYLRKDYKNLTTVDLVCHGVPSPMVWRDYLHSQFDFDTIRTVNFRDKRSGWRNYAITIADNKGIHSEPFTENKYALGFSRNIYIRESCFACPTKLRKSRADITIADYWLAKEIVGKFDDNRGVGLVLTHTQRGTELYKSIEREDIETTYEDALRGNPIMEKFISKPESSAIFWSRYPLQGFNAIDGLIELGKRKSALSRWVKDIKNYIKYRIV